MPRYSDNNFKLGHYPNLRRRTQVIEGVTRAQSRSTNSPEPTGFGGFFYLETSWEANLQPPICREKLYSTLLSELLICRHPPRSTNPLAESSRYPTTVGTSALVTTDSRIICRHRTYEAFLHARTRPMDYSREEAGSPSRFVDVHCCAGPRDCTSTS